LCTGSIISVQSSSTENDDRRLLRKKASRGLQNLSSFSDPSSSQPRTDVWYVPAKIEEYIMANSVALGYDSKSDPKGCTIYSDPTVTNSEFHAGLMSYVEDLDGHTAAVKAFQPIGDLHEAIAKSGSSDVCATARIVPEGLESLFRSGQLSMTTSGLVEPLLPPMRQHNFCSDKKQLMNMDYLVHDFEAMCNKLKPWSKKILIDMGASLSFHGGGSTQPIVTLLDLYEKFGFQFDHIYGFEITFTEPAKVFTELLPEKYLPNYHWINVGVSSEEGGRLNPLHSILKQFDEDDFIVVKLDIDTNWIEVPLAMQLLEDKDGVYHKLVDQFYFEHHVHLGELKSNWKSSMEGTVKDSLELFYGLREKGIPSHFWP